MRTLLNPRQPPNRLLADLGLTRRAADAGKRAAGGGRARRWDRRLVWLIGGWAAFAAWMATSEALLRVNTPARGTSTRRGAAVAPVASAAALGGVAVANAAPHLASAAAGREHLTPLAGRRSSPGLNLLWGAVNLGAGLALVRRAVHVPGPRWDRTLLGFEAGWASFAAVDWAAEALVGYNSDAGDNSDGDPAAGTPP